MASLASTILLALLAPCSGHITLNPNYGAFAGNYFMTNLKVSQQHSLSRILNRDRGNLLLGFQKKKKNLSLPIVFQTQIPHGVSGYFTTKVTLNVPNGILSAVPEAKPGWTISETTRSIPPYVSHGTTVSTAPATITWTADCQGIGAPAVCTNYPADPIGLDSDHLLEFGVQVKLGCDFGIDTLTGTATTDASIWMDEYTMWE